MFRITICLLCIFWGCTSSPAQYSDFRSIGGQEASPGQFPWQVALLTSLGMGYPEQIGCGGSIISRVWILTAAHCLDPFSVRTLRVLPGTINNKDTRNAIEALTWKRHYYDDVGVVKLRYPLNFNQYIQPIALSSQALPTNVKIIVSGWGATGTPFGGIIYPSTLRYVDLVVDDRCMLSLPGHNIYKEFCAVSDSPFKRKNTCSGDSGSPAVIQQYGYYEQVGIVSFGDTKPCGRLGGFVRVSYFRDWIHRNTMI